MKLLCAGNAVGIVRMGMGNMHNLLRKQGWVAAITLGEHGTIGKKRNIPTRATAVALKIRHNAVHGRRHSHMLRMLIVLAANHNLYYCMTIRAIAYNGIERKNRSQDKKQQ